MNYRHFYYFWIVGEFEDSALMAVFGAKGVAVMHILCFSASCAFPNWQGARAGSDE